MKLLMMRLAEGYAVVRIKAQVFVICKTFKVVWVQISGVLAANNAFIVITRKHRSAPITVLLTLSEQFALISFTLFWRESVWVRLCFHKRKMALRTSFRMP